MLGFLCTYSPDDIRCRSSYLVDVETVERFYVLFYGVVEFFDSPFFAEIYFRHG